MIEARLRVDAERRGDEAARFWRKNQYLKRNKEELGRNKGKAREKQRGAGC